MHFFAAAARYLWKFLTGESSFSFTIHVTSITVRSNLSCQLHDCPTGIGFYTAVHCFSIYNDTDTRPCELHPGHLYFSWLTVPNSQKQTIPSADCGTKWRMTCCALSADCHAGTHKKKVLKQSFHNRDCHLSLNPCSVTLCTMPWFATSLCSHHRLSPCRFLSFPPSNCPSLIFLDLLPTLVSVSLLPTLVSVSWHTQMRFTWSSSCLGRRKFQYCSPGPFLCAIILAFYLCTFWLECAISELFLWRIGGSVPSVGVAVCKVWVFRIWTEDFVGGREVTWLFFFVATYPAPLHTKN